MRLMICGLACMLMSGCVTAGGDAKPDIAAAPVAAFPYPDKAVVASTMEVRVDTSAVGDISPEKVGRRLALALATITEFQPDSGKAVTPIRSAVVSPDGAGGSTLKQVFSPNAYRQSTWMDDHDKVVLDRRVVEPGWYLVHSFGSTAGFAMDKPRTGQRACLQYGAVPAPGVEPVSLGAGEVGYFGHFVITIAVHPGTDADTPYTLTVADAEIEPGPPGLDDLLRRDGLDPAHVRRIPADNFPCPWSVPRLASN